MGGRSPLEMPKKSWIMVIAGFLKCFHSFLRRCPLCQGTSHGRNCSGRSQVQEERREMSFWKDWPGTYSKNSITLWIRGKVAHDNKELIVFVLALRASQLAFNLSRPYCQQINFRNGIIFKIFRNGIIEGLVVATSLLWEGFRQPFQKPVAAWVVRWT